MTEALSLRELARANGVSRSTLSQRVRDGMTVEQALAAPIRRVDVNAVGQKYGKLTVLRFVGRTPERRVVWEASCECGTPAVIVTDNMLKKGDALSCGCARRAVLASRGAANREKFAVYELRGQRYSLAELASTFRIDARTLSKRIKLWGWTVEAAVTIPVAGRPLSGEAAKLALRTPLPILAKDEADGSNREDCDRSAGGREDGQPLGDHSLDGDRGDSIEHDDAGSRPLADEASASESPARTLQSAGDFRVDRAVPASQAVESQAGKVPPFALIGRPPARPSPPPVRRLDLVPDDQVTQRTDIIGRRLFNAKLSAGSCIDRQMAAGAGKPSTMGRVANVARHLANLYARCADCAQGARIATRLAPSTGEAAE